MQGDAVFITRLFHPLIAFSPDEPAAGGEVPTPETTEAPTADQPDVTTPDAPEAPEAGTSDTEVPETPDAPESDTESFTDVNTDDLPEDVATRYQQMQADYTRKTQALAERNTELDAVQSFAVDLLADEPNDTQEAVFRTLAERLGYELEGGDEPAEGDEPGTETPEFHDPRLDPILAEREAKAEPTPRPPVRRSSTRRAGDRRPASRSSRRRTASNSPRRSRRSSSRTCSRCPRWTNGPNVQGRVRPLQGGRRRRTRTGGSSPRGPLRHPPASR
jgi:hypothetical protein